MVGSGPSQKQDQEITAISGTWIYQFFNWYCSCRNVAEGACSMKAPPFLTEFPTRKFWFSHIFDNTVWQFEFEINQMLRMLPHYVNISNCIVELNVSPSYKYPVFLWRWFVLLSAEELLLSLFLSLFAISNQAILSSRSLQLQCGPIRAVQYCTCLLHKTQFTHGIQDPTKRSTALEAWNCYHAGLRVAVLCCGCRTSDPHT